MQIKEVKNEGLIREYAVTLSPEMVAKQVDAELQKIAKKVKIDGFRPGKIPATLLQERYGDVARSEALETLAKKIRTDVVVDKKLRPAMPAQISDFKDDGDKGVSMTISLEILPEIQDVNLEKISLEKLTIAVPDSKVQDFLANLIRENKTPKALDKPRASKLDDLVTIDFEGKIQGVAFDGGKGEKYPLHLGSNSFIPGFEDQLVGKNVGDKVDVKVAFPQDYHAEDLKGKDAVFHVHIHDVQEMVGADMNDEWAKGLGFESLEKLKEHLKGLLADGYAKRTRDRSKRELLDHLDQVVSCPLPLKMVDNELDTIIRQLQDSHDHGDHSDCNHDHAHDHAAFEGNQDEYRPLAERRVKLGLVLADIGNKLQIQVSNQVLNNAIYQEAVKYPGQEKEVFNFFKSTPQALAQLRATLFEDLVVDHIFGKIKFNEREVSLEEFEKEEEKAEQAAEEKLSPKKKEGKKAASAKN